MRAWIVSSEGEDDRIFYDKTKSVMAFLRVVEKFEAREIAQNPSFMAFKKKKGGWIIWQEVVIKDIE